MTLHPMERETIRRMNRMGFSPQRYIASDEDFDDDYDEEDED